jgi:hypothetical protein
MNPPNRVKLRRFSPWLGLLIALVCTASSHATRLETKSETTDTFRWIHPSTDPQLWQQIESAFQDELTPDDAKPGQDNLDVYRYKYLKTIGISTHSVLVIICRRPAKEMTKETAWDEYCSAFNFDLATKQKSTIEHADVMWKWKFKKLAKFGPTSVPDVTFTYFTCSECEPALMFASLYYEETKSAWQVRSWGDGKDLWWTVNDGLVVDFDNIGSGDTISFDCVYGILDLKGNGFDDVVMRCKEVSYNDARRAKIDDSTVLYSSSGRQFKRRRVTDESEAVELTAKICRPNTASMLCKLPAYMTATSGQSAALDVMFPKAPKTVRDLAHFRALKRTMSMSEVVHQCGEPDEIGGSGLIIFIYHLDDGSLVTIGAAGATGPLFYANHIATTGKASALFPAELETALPKVSPTPD